MTRFLSANLIILGILGIANAPAYACEPKHEFRTVESGTLKVALNVYPPFTEVTADGTIEGVDSEVVKRFAEENCLKIESQVLDQSAQIQSIMTNKVDVSIYAWSRTRERDKVMGLSVPMYLDRLAIYSKSGINTIEGLYGKTIGVRAADFFASDLQKIKEITVKTYPNQASQTQDLQSGRIDAIVDGYSLGAYTKKTKNAYHDIKIEIIKPDARVPFTVKGAQSTILYNKKNTELGAALDASIEEMRNDGYIRDMLVGYGFDASLADVGDPSFVQ
ncbi:substrate-binding periplasmic protein [Mesorhizobium sp. PL10]